MAKSISHRNRVFCADGEEQLDALAQRFGATRRGLQCAEGSPVAVVCAGGLEACAAAAWLAQHDTEGLILTEDRLTAAVREVLLRAGYHLLHPSGTSERPAEIRPPHPGQISVLTSGTTGVPKLVPHNWETLHTTRDGHRATAQRWLVTYQPGTYAWFQVLTLALFREGHDLILASRSDPVDLVEAALRHGATAVSATPTFWRMVLLQHSSEFLIRLPLRQITLGGEPVDQKILDRLHSIFPGAALTHIYASTEVGACIVVTDGREGFPAQWIEPESPGTVEPVEAVAHPRPPTAAYVRRPRLRVERGTLHVLSPHSSTDSEGWRDTGDLVEFRGDRAVVIGRKDSAIVNVGGAKVALRDVEAALLEDPRVVWCRAYGRRAPLVGSLVGIDLVPSAGSPAPETLEPALVAGLRLRLPEAAVPRVWRFLDRIPATDNLKTEPGEFV